MTNDTLRPLFVVLQIVAYVVLATHLWRTRLGYIYRALLAYLAFETARLVLTSAITRGTSLYAWMYIYTQPILWVITAWMTLEVFQVVFRARPGISSASRRLVTVSLAVSIGLASLTLMFDVRRHNSPSELLENFLTFERVINSSLLLFVVLLMAGLAWFPVPLSRNALVHASIFTFFFASKTGLVLVRNVMGPSWNPTTNFVLLAASLTSILLWRFRLTAEGEVSKVSSGVKRSPADEAILLEKLDRLNEALSGSLRK